MLLLLLLLHPLPRFVHWGLKYSDLIEHRLLPQRAMGRGSVWAGFSVYHRAAIMMATLTK